MKSIWTVILTFLFTLSAYSQINVADSTVQVVGYWSKNDKQTYRIDSEKMKIQGNDSTITEKYNYNVDVTILDSTANSYLIEWKYGKINLEKGSDIMKKMMESTQEMSVIIRTDEFGAFQEVVNWKDVRDYIAKSMALLRKDYKEYPTMIKLFKQMEDTYATKEAIEKTTIDEIRQFYNFHGGKYELKRMMTGKIKTLNKFGPVPFDSELTVYLDTINTKDSNFILRASQEVDSEQLTNATYDYMVSMAKTMGIPAPDKSSLKGLENTTDTSSCIHETGWVIYSVETKTVTADNVTNIDERTIELQ